MQENNFYDYNDYRLLMRKKFEFLKASRKKMSLEVVADSIGISKSFFKMILDQERHISIDKLSGVARAFNMDRNERNYFIFLACKNLVEDPNMDEFFGNILRVLKAQKGADFHNFEEDLISRNVFESSLKMTLTSLKRFKDFQDDPQWVQKQLADKTISVEEIEKAQQELKAAAPAIENLQGRSVPTGHFLEMSVGLNLVAKACATPEIYKPVQFHMCSLSFDEENEKKAFQLFSEFQNKLKELSTQSQDPISVLFISNNMICVANKAT